MVQQTTPHAASCTPIAPDGGMPQPGEDRSSLQPARPRGLLEPCAGKLARAVLGGSRRGTPPGLPDNTAADHVAVLRNALRQLPGHRAGTQPGQKVLIRIDGAGCTHELLDWIVAQRMSYSVGFTLPADFADQLTNIPNKVWTPAHNSDGEILDGAWVAEITGLLNL